MTITAGDGDPRHGTLNGYKNLLCRCDMCRSAATKARVEWSHRTGRRRSRAEYLKDLAQKEPPPHGTQSRYSNQGCRCDLCREADKEAKRERYARLDYHQLRDDGTRCIPRAEYLQKLRDSREHGTYAKYHTDKCRCNPCKLASRAYHAARAGGWPLLS